MYTKSRFWRFLLDTKAGARYPDEPRFKQFSENLRNFAVATVMFKAAQFIVAPNHNPFLLIGRFLLYGLATATTVFYLIQLLGLIIVAFHRYVGWGVMDDIALKRSKQRRKNFRAIGLNDGYLIASLKLCALLIVPLLSPWAMLAFVLSPVR